MEKLTKTNTMIENAMKARDHDNSQWPPSPQEVLNVINELSNYYGDKLNTIGKLYTKQTSESVADQ